MGFPGMYPLGGAVNVNDLIAVAGGYSPGANKNAIEIINVDQNFNNSNIVFPGAKISIPSLNLEKESIQLSGEIEDQRKIGFFEGIKLSDIFTSFNNLSENAY